MINPTFLQQYYAITFDPIQETLDHISRVETAGGTVPYPELLDAILVNEIDASRFDASMLRLFGYRIGQKSSGGSISDLYGADPNETDFSSVGLDDTDEAINFDGSTNLQINEGTLGTWSCIVWLRVAEGRSGTDHLVMSGTNSRGVIATSGDNRLAYRDNDDYTFYSTIQDLTNWVCAGWSGEPSSSGTARIYANGVKKRTKTGIVDASLRANDISNGLYEDQIDVFYLRNDLLSDQDFLDFYNATKKFFGH